MNVVEFLKSEIIMLPKERNKTTQKDLLQYIKDTNIRFLDALSKLDIDDEVGKHVLPEIVKISTLCDGVLGTVTEYFKGNPQNAYNTLCAAIRAVSSDLEKLILHVTDPEYYENFYRIRKMEDHFFGRNEMFHIPFDLRHIIKTQRYSIPGFPSLYLSSSIFTAWKELGMPALDDVIAVRCELKAPIKILDLGYSPQYFAKVYGVIYQQPGETPKPEKPRAIEYMSSYIKCWPLMFACAIKVLNKEGHFKPEYIVPQILLQGVRNNELGVEIDGIKYSSTHIETIQHSTQLACNYVFPVKTFANEGLCSELADKFHITEPVSWQLSKAMTQKPELHKIQDIFIELIKGQESRYSDTDFGLLEGRLLGMNATKIS